MVEFVGGHHRAEVGRARDEDHLGTAPADIITSIKNLTGG